MAIIKSEDGNPWDFADKYIYQSHVIEFGVLHNFAKEGPLYGNLIIDGSIVSNAKCNGFGGPVLFKDELLYVPLYQYATSKFDIVGAYIAEVNLVTKSVRIIGTKYPMVYIDHMEDSLIYFYVYWCKQKDRLESIDIHTKLHIFTSDDFNMMRRKYELNQKKESFFGKLLYRIIDKFGI